jgi:phosphoribosylformylglycinamidine synthase PurS subunit
MKARIVVTLKSGILDPQGKAIEGALKSLGLEGVSSVRQGKVFDVELDGADQEVARRTLTLACDKLLSNPIVEKYAIDIG